MHDDFDHATQFKPLGTKFHLYESDYVKPILRYFIH